MSRRAIITGITGQDGSYLAELLLDKGYHVVGITRRLSSSNYWRIEHLLDHIELRPAEPASGRVGRARRGLHLLVEPQASGGTNRSGLSSSRPYAVSVFGRTRSA